MRILLCPDPENHPMTFYNILVKAAGVQSPAKPPAKEGEEAIPPEPFYMEAKFFTERALLHRRITLKPTGRP